MGNLTADKVRKASEPGRYSDGVGLYLLISPGGSKSWTQRLRIDGKPRDKGLGSFPTVTLSQARKLATSHRAKIDLGGDPFEAKGTITKPELVVGPVATTFEGLAREVHPIQARQFKNDKHGKNWLQTLEKHVFPHLGAKPVTDITRRDVIACLEPIWYDLPDSARRIRLRIRAVLDYAVEMEMITVNVERGITKLSLAPQPKTKEHFAALIPGDVPAAYRKIGKSKSLPATRLAFQLLILTACRSGEVRGATWAEIDGDTWTIPAERMKAGKEHIVPLSIQAQVLLREAREKLGGDGLIFPGEGGNPLSDNALSLRARKEDLGCVPHGFRSSARTFWTAQGAGWEAIELSLGHAVGNTVAQAYFRTAMVEERKPMYQSWADYIEPLPF